MLKKTHIGAISWLKLLLKMATVENGFNAVSLITSWTMMDHEFL